MIKGIASQLSIISIIPVIVLFCTTPAHLEASSHRGSGEKQQQVKKIESQLFSQKGKLRTVYFQEKDLLDTLLSPEHAPEETKRKVYSLAACRLAIKEGQDVDAVTARELFQQCLGPYFEGFLLFFHDNHRH